MNLEYYNAIRIWFNFCLYLWPSLVCNIVRSGSLFMLFLYIKEQLTKHNGPIITLFQWKWLSFRQQQWSVVKKRKAVQIVHYCSYTNTTGASLLWHSSLSSADRPGWPHGHWWVCCQNEWIQLTFASARRTTAHASLSLLVLASASHCHHIRRDRNMGGWVYWWYMLHLW